MKKIFFRIILCVFGFLACLALAFLAFIYYPVFFPLKVRVNPENMAILNDGYSLVRFSSNVDLLDLKNRAVDYYCFVHQNASEFEGEDCVLLPGNQAFGKSVSWKYRQLNQVAGVYYFNIRYKKINKAEKVKLQLRFVMHVISNPINIYIDG